MDSPWKSLNDVNDLEEGIYLGEFIDDNKGEPEYHVIKVMKNVNSTLRLIGSYFAYDMYHLKPLRYMEIPE